MVRFKEELATIHALEKRIEASQSTKEKYHLNRELMRRRKEYKSAMMYFATAMKERKGKD